VHRDRAPRHAGRRRLLPPRRPPALRAARDARRRLMPEPSLRRLLDVAIDVAWAGGRRTLAHFNTGLAVDRKRDGTPVTQADREAETVMRAIITRTFPDHAILGEE